MSTAAVVKPIYLLVTDCELVILWLLLCRERHRMLRDDPEFDELNSVATLLEKVVAIIDPLPLTHEERGG